jgi:hypothetical protein
MESAGAWRGGWEGSSGGEAPEREEEFPCGEVNVAGSWGAEGSAEAACGTTCESPTGVGAGCPKKFAAASTAITEASAGKRERGAVAGSGSEEGWASGEPLSDREWRMGSAMSKEKRREGKRQNEKTKALVHEL